MRISVVIPTWNGRPLLEACLPALDAQDLGEPFQVVVVDNGSADGTLEWLRDARPDVGAVAFDGNRGFAAAVNAGIAASATEYVALLNNDALPEAAWLRALVAALERRPECGFAASRILSMHEPPRLDSAGDGASRYGSIFKRGDGALADGRFLEEEVVVSACAGAALYRRRVLEDVGPFEEEFFAYFEDIDWSLRARLRGHRCVYVPDAVVRHAVSATGARLPRVVRLQARNHLYVLLRNFPLRRLLYASPVVLAGRALVLAAQIRNGNGRQTLLGYLDVVRSLPWVIRGRARIQSRRTVAVGDFVRALDRRLLPEESRRHLPFSAGPLGRLIRPFRLLRRPPLPAPPSRDASAPLR